MSNDPIYELLHRPANVFPGAELFGVAASKRTLADVLQLLRQSFEDDARSAVAAYGMVLTLNTGLEDGYRDEALNALDQLALAKALIDQAANHLPPIINITSEILLAAQIFTDDATIPCTEWPYVTDIARVVLEKSRIYAMTAA